MTAGPYGIYVGTSMQTWRTTKKEAEAAAAVIRKRTKKPVTVRKLK